MLSQRQTDTGSGSMMSQRQTDTGCGSMLSLRQTDRHRLWFHAVTKTDRHRLWFHAVTKTDRHRLWFHAVTKTDRHNFIRFSLIAFNSVSVRDIKAICQLEELLQISFCDDDAHTESFRLLFTFWTYSY